MTHAEMDRIISEWRGECHGEQYCPKCYGVDAPAYSTDPGAWTPELFREIEERGLAIKMTNNLAGPVYNVANDNVLRSVHYERWTILKSEPEQKALALVRAIQEGK